MPCKSCWLLWVRQGSEATDSQGPAKVLRRAEEAGKDGQSHAVKFVAKVRYSDEIYKFLKGKGFTNIKEVEVMPENVRFGLPPEIVEAIEAAPAAVAE